jgi:hypothetical protein
VKTIRVVLWRCSAGPRLRFTCHAEVKAGTAALKKLRALEGDPGVWAAPTLTRRGDKDAAARSPEALRELHKD